MFHAYFSYCVCSVSVRMLKSQANGTTLCTYNTCSVHQITDCTFFLIHPFMVTVFIPEDAYYLINAPSSRKRVPVSQMGPFVKFWNPSKPAHATFQLTDLKISSFTVSRKNSRMKLERDSSSLNVQSFKKALGPILSRTSLIWTLRTQMTNFLSLSLMTMT